MRKFLPLLLLLCTPIPALATIFAQLHGIVHDPQHRPIQAAQITLKATTSAFTLTTQTAPDGSFALPSIPLGDYTILITAPNFAPSTQTLTLASNTTPILHIELALASAHESITVTSDSQPAANINTATPTTLINREDIAATPGADRTNSLAAITDFTPGAYMTHDMLHMRGGHQVAWQIDGVEIPNTNIASNHRPPDRSPSDIDYPRGRSRHLQRGPSATAPTASSTSCPAPALSATAMPSSSSPPATSSRPDDQLNLWATTPQNFAWYASLNANRSDDGLQPHPSPSPLNDADQRLRRLRLRHRQQGPRATNCVSSASSAPTTTRSPRTPTPPSWENAPLRLLRPQRRRARNRRPTPPSPGCTPSTPSTVSADRAHSCTSTHADYSANPSRPARSQPPPTAPGRNLRRSCRAPSPRSSVAKNAMLRRPVYWLRPA